MNTQKQSNRQPRNSSANIDVVISWGAARKNRVQKEKKKKLTNAQAVGIHNGFKGSASE